MSKREPVGRRHLAAEPKRAVHARKSSRVLMVLLILVAAVGFAITGMGVFMERSKPTCPEDLYGNCVVMDVAPAGVNEVTGAVDGGVRKPGAIEIPAIGLDLGLRYMETTTHIINPLDSKNFWLDVSSSPGWPNFDGRLLVSAHSLPIVPDQPAAGAGNTLMGTGPGITGWPKNGDEVIINQTAHYRITELFHEPKGETGVDPRVLEAESLVIITCYHGPGHETDPIATDNFVILAEPVASSMK